MAVRDRAQNHSPWQTAQRADQTNGPENTGDPSHTKGLAADVYDHDLAADHDEIDAQEPVVPEHTFEDVEAVIQTAVVKFIEDLHPNESVEDDCRELL